MRMEIVGGGQPSYRNLSGLVESSHDKDNSV